MEDEIWLIEALADVLIWEVAHPEQYRYVKVMGDFGAACCLTAYLEENGYEVIFEPLGIYNQITIER